MFPVSLVLTPKYSYEQVVALVTAFVSLISWHPDSIHTSLYNITHFVDQDPGEII